MSAVSVLLGAAIDYAGLFPPAKLAMPDAVQRHATYLASPHRALLGRFVVPLARLAEFESCYDRLPPIERRGWELSVLAAESPAADTACIAAFHARHPDARIASLETKASTPAEVVSVTTGLPPEIEIWVELPATPPDLPALLAAVRATGRGAKLRMGGVTADAFPAPAAVARFMAACRDSGVVFKATAGLHHPVRGDYRLTYEPGAACGTMFGFLNVFLAAALIHGGGEPDQAAALLTETDPGGFTVGAESLGWRGHRFSAEQLATTRQNLCRSFGSCSFTEPIEGLQQLHWL